ncbi:hypothetical protein V2J09_018238 [Rumex salicifolius]
MEIGMSTIVVSVVIALVLAMAWRALNWVWLTPKKVERILRKQHLSGNPYRLLIGDTFQIIRMVTEAQSNPMDFSHDISSRVEPFLHQTINKHGKNPFAWLGNIPMVVVSEAEVAKEVLSRMSDFPKLYFRSLALIAPGLVSYDGQKWAKHRKLINPAFHLDKLKLMVPAFQTSCSDMISIWEELVPQTGSVELDVWPHFTTLTADAISKAAFGSSFEDGRKTFELIQEQIELFNKKALEWVFPALRQVCCNAAAQTLQLSTQFLPTRENRRFEKAQKDIQTIIENVIEKRRKALEAGEAPKNDLLGLLIKYSDETPHNDLGITTRELIDECKLFYFAGQETTSVLLTFTMILLSKYTDWQEQAREEVFKTFGQNPPDFDKLNHLKTVTMILYEVLRLYPPLPTIVRMAKHDTRVGSLTIPAGTLMFIPLILAHHDPQHWGEDATEFKPERFSEGISKASKEGVAFLPFGWGPRVCVGQNFALVEAKMVLAMILQRFSFELSPSYAHAPTLSVTLRPQFGAQLLSNLKKEKLKTLKLIASEFSLEQQQKQTY